MVEDFRGRVLGGQFTIGELIGQGGYGWVYEARQASPDRIVAVKILRDRAVDPARARVSEAQALARASHPNAVGVIASGIEPDDGLMWIAMQLVDGISLRAWFQSFGKMPLVDVVPLVEQIASAIHTAHRRGIVHRDLKPENIMVTPDDQGRLVATLLDFGIAKSKHDKARPDVAKTKDDDEASEPGEVHDGAVTSRGVVSTSSTTRRRLRVLATPATAPSDGSIGTPEYRAPELATDPKRAGPAADVYALGLIAYEALAGRKPFEGTTPEEWRELHETSMIGPIGVGSAAVYRAVHRALAKSPAARWPTAVEFARALRDAHAADPAEQFKTSARIWEERGRPPDLLWGPRALAAVERRQQIAQDDVLGRAFFVASRRRTQVTRWKVIAAVLAIVVAVGAYRSYKNGETSEAIAVQAEADQGQQSLLHNEFTEAQRHLGEAYRRGDHSPATQFMLARAVEPRLAEQAEFAATSGRMWSARFSPDGTQIVTTDDKAAQVWDAVTHRLMFQLPHDGPVYDAVYSPDGTRLITVTDHAVRIWSATTGNPLLDLQQQRLDGAPPDYFRVALSRDGRLVAAIDSHGAELHAWDIDGAPLARVPLTPALFPLLTFSVDGQWLAATGGDDVFVLDTSHWQLVTKIAAPHVRAITSDPTRPHLAIATAGGDAAIWEISSGVRMHHLREIGEGIDLVAYSPDGRLLVTGAHDGSEQLWDAHTGQLRNQLHELHGQIQALEFDSGSGSIAAGSGRVIVVADASLATPVLVLETTGVLDTMHFHPTSHSVVSASSDGTAQVWSATSPYRNWSVAPVNDSNNCGLVTSLEPDRRFVAIGCRDWTLVWDTAQDRLLAKLPGDPSAGNDVAPAWPAVSTSGDLAAIALGNTVEVFELPRGRLVRTVPHGAKITALAFAPGSHDLVSGSADGHLALTRDGEEPRALPASRQSIDAVTFIDTEIIAADAAKRLRFFSRSGIPTREVGIPDRAMTLRVSPDGRRLVIGASYTDVSQPSLWDLPQHRLVAKLSGHAPVFAIRFVKGRIITAGIDGAARLWDASTGELVQTYQSAARFLADADMDPSGEMLVAGDAEGVVRFWDIRTARPLWNLRAHSSAVVGLHFEGGDLVTRGFGGDIAHWRLPAPTRVLDACRASACGNVVP